MSFTLHFNSFENTKLLDIFALEELGKCTHSNKFDSIVFDANFNQPIPKLPAFIKHIDFGRNFKANISDIGEHIETIIFHCVNFNYDLSTFPKGLKKLSIVCDNITSRIENINPGLATLTIQCGTFNDELYLTNTNITSIDISSNAFNHSLPHLPPGLKTLAINSDKFNSPVDNLPIGQECLTICSSMFNQPMDNLPSGLKTLILQNISVFRQPLHNLPHGLENFDLNLGYHYDNANANIYTHTLANLPSSIRKMVLANYWGDLNTINDGIVELDIWFPPNKKNDAHILIQNWTKLPSALQKLDINKVLSMINKKHNMTDIIKSNIHINLKGIYLNGVMM